MSKDIQILKFAVKRNGVRFGPGLPAGNVIYGLPDEEADHLIAESNGTIVELPKREDVEKKVAAAQTAATVTKQKPIEKMNKDELRAYAELNKIDLGDAETKNEMLAVIKGKPAGDNDNAPAAGADGLGSIDPNSTIGK